MAASQATNGRSCAGSEHAAADGTLAGAVRIAGGQAKSGTDDRQGESHGPSPFL
jgi:hypothetical protein